MLKNTFSSIIYPNNLLLVYISFFLINALRHVSKHVSPFLCIIPDFFKVKTDMPTKKNFYLVLACLFNY